MFILLAPLDALQENKNLKVQAISPLDHKVHPLGFISEIRSEGYLQSQSWTITRWQQKSGPWKTETGPRIAHILS